jgi:hypothetical protein
LLNRGRKKAFLFYFSIYVGKRIDIMDAFRLARSAIGASIISFLAVGILNGADRTSTGQTGVNPYEKKVLVVEYRQEKYLSGRWNPFVEPEIAYRWVPSQRLVSESEFRARSRPKSDGWRASNNQPGGTISRMAQKGAAMEPNSHFSKLAGCQPWVNAPITFERTVLSNGPQPQTVAIKPLTPIHTPPVGTALDRDFPSAGPQTASLPVRGWLLR